MKANQTDLCRPELLRKMDAYWRAANYLSVGQIYLMDNPLLRAVEAGARETAVARALGNDARAEFRLRAPQSAYHGTRPEHDLHLRAGTWWAGLVGNTYLEGTYSEVYPGMTQDEAGMQRLFKQFSFPGGIPSHVSPETPARSMKAASSDIRWQHAFGAVFDDPDLIVACVVGDGEAETGPLATAWHSNKFLNPATDGGFCRSYTSTVTKSPTPPCWRVSAVELETVANRLRLQTAFRRRVDPKTCTS